MQNQKNIHLKISLSQQCLELWQGQDLRKSYPISSAKNGAGECKNSFQTPRGRHIIRAKIGQNAPIFTAFKARRPTGEICTPAVFAQNRERDWILTRILWLSGCELGKNRLGDVDSMRRFIYIHGTPERDKIGTPASHGCIRMRCEDLMELFEIVPCFTQVDIVE